MAFDETKEKHPGGRPRIYSNPDDLATKCDDYFEQCKNDKVRPILTGLVLFLGFADKTTLYEYRDRQEFSYPIKRAISRIEAEYENRLTDNSVAGTIFALKNMGWKDRSEIAPVDPDGNSLRSFTDEQVDELLTAIRENK